MYITGPSNGEGLADMDIDCDGANNSAGDCANDPSGQGQTAFKHEVQDYGIEDLDSNKHSFVVLGNEGASPEYMPTSDGVESLSIVAVVCANKLVSRNLSCILSHAFLTYVIINSTMGSGAIPTAAISLEKPPSLLLKLASPMKDLMETTDTPSMTFFTSHSAARTLNPVLVEQTGAPPTLANLKNLWPRLVISLFLRSPFKWVWRCLPGGKGGRLNDYYVHERI